MKITFLGTGAASAYPLPFCLCENCIQARRFGGRSLRKRSSLLINNDLLIDPGPDIMSACFMHGCSIADVRYSLLTHSHSDHLDASHLITRIPEYAGVNTPHLDLYASTASMKMVSEAFKREWEAADIFNPKERERLNLEIHEVKAFQSFKVGNYQVAVFSSEHDKSVDSLLYVIKENGFTVFYGVDTPILSEETWKGFYEKKFKFDIVILDHTYGPGIPGEGHLNAEQFIEHIKRMRKENFLAENARIFATHISHEGNPVHPELVKYAKKNGYEIAYDGLKIKI